MQFLGAVKDIIVIDNNLDEGLSRQVKAITNRYSGAKYYKCLQPGLTAARHMALTVCDSEIISYVDDDILFTDTWHQSIISVFEDPNVVLAGGPSLPFFIDNIPNWFWHFTQGTPYGGWSCSWLSLLDIGKDIFDVNPNWIWGLNFSIRKESIIKLGGFHIDLVPKDFENLQGDGETGLTNKIKNSGQIAAYINNAKVYHLCSNDRLSVEYFCKRASYEGRCNAYTDCRYLLTSKGKIVPRAFISAVKRGTLILSKYIMFSLGSILLSGSIKDYFTVRKHASLSYLNAYITHLRTLLSNQSMREWVCRNDYIQVELTKELPVGM
jgi:glycosyltransferase involved in cell wall biosynthesis